MKNIISLLLIMSLNIVVFSQDTVAYKADKTTNKFIYSENTIKIFAGQQISISPINKKLKNIKLVDTGESKIVDISKIAINVLKQNSNKNIVIDCNIIKQEDGTFMTFLIVNNPYEKALSYKAKIYSREKDSYIDTDVIDIQPGISGIENWPYSISDFVLYDFTLKE